MANTLPTLVWVSDAHGFFTFLNQPWVDLTGRPIAELQGNGWVECVHPVDRQRCQERFSAAVQARRSFAMEYRVRGVDGGEHWLKYAKAQEVHVTLMGKEEGIRLRLCGDGIGSDLAHARCKGGLGLASMRERLRLIDGRLAIRTRPGAGTHIDVWVPLNGRP
jgi:PAS domain S-box-containing protein